MSSFHWHVGIDTCQNHLTKMQHSSLWRGAPGAQRAIYTYVVHNQLQAKGGQWPSKCRRGSVASTFAALAAGRPTPRSGRLFTQCCAMLPSGAPSTLRLSARKEASMDATWKMQVSGTWCLRRAWQVRGAHARGRQAAWSCRRWAGAWARRSVHERRLPLPTNRMACHLMPSLLGVRTSCRAANAMSSAPAGCMQAALQTA